VDRLRRRFQRHAHRAFDGDAMSHGNVLFSKRSGFAVSIEAGCNGVEALLVLAAAMLAFPAPWRMKLIGLAIGAVAIQALNIVRVISLYYLGQWKPRRSSGRICTRGRRSSCSTPSSSGFCGSARCHARPPRPHALWLVPCLALWYVAAGPIAWLPAKIASPFIGVVADVKANGAARAGESVYSVSIDPPYELMTRGTGAATADVEVASATYTYASRSFLALSLATRGWSRPKLVLAGLVIVWLSSAWGIGFDAVRQLRDLAGARVAPGAGGCCETAIAFGYQLGSLLLPTLLPIALWLAFNPQAWRRTPGA
jgi:hypothetical protein